MYHVQNVLRSPRPPAFFMFHFASVSLKKNPELWIVILVWNAILFGLWFPRNSHRNLLCPQIIFRSIPIRSTFYYFLQLNIHYGSNYCCYLFGENFLLKYKYFLRQLSWLQPRTNSISCIICWYVYDHLVRVDASSCGSWIFALKLQGKVFLHICHVVLRHWSLLHVSVHSRSLHFCAFG